MVAWLVLFEEFPWEWNEIQGQAGAGGGGGWEEQAAGVGCVGSEAGAWGNSAGVISR